MRKSGILFHISSLPSRFGIGKLGDTAYDFVDFIHDCGFGCWQILPLSPTGYGDSPYQSFSIHAGNPYFIDFDTLCDEGLLDREDFVGIRWQNSNRAVDYDLQYRSCLGVLRTAYDNFKEKGSEDSGKFFAENAYWLDDYALFMALKTLNDGKPWYEWDEKIRNRDEVILSDISVKLEEEIGFQKFIQFKFFEQWFRLKKYANSKGIQIIGDIPIYTALDSVEAWANPELFRFNARKEPTAVAGCPPDAFAPTGQLWGNPLYDWAYHKKTCFGWWLERISFSSKLYDTIRIDHFRGFESYYSIPFGSKTAEKGKWCKAPGRELFKALKKAYPDIDIIAENLGFLTPEVNKLLKETGYPGMKVLQFGFDNGKNIYLPHNYESTNCVVYTGTHDNSTLVGWVRGLDKKSLSFCKEYLCAEKKRDIPDKLIRLAWQSTAECCIAPLQDFLELDDSARMNIPSTLGGNWQFRALAEDFTPQLKKRIRKLNKLYNRYSKKRKGDNADEASAADNTNES